MEWLNFVTTAKARGKIRHILRKERRTVISLGQKKLYEYLESKEIKPTDENISHLIPYYKVDNKDDLFYAIGEGTISPDERTVRLLKEKNENRLTRYLKLFTGTDSKEKKEPINEINSIPKINPKKTYLLIDDGINKNYQVASCCHPIPGDEVLGFIDPNNNTIVVHKRTCRKALKLKNTFGDQLLSVEWVNTNATSYPANIQIKGIDGLGVLYQIIQVISEDHSINIRKISFESNDGIFLGKLQMEVQNVEDISLLCSRLLKIKSIQSVSRIDDTI